MVVVKIELWNHGDPEDCHTLGEIRITNDGTGNQQLGNYDVTLAHAAQYAGRAGHWKTGKIRGFFRHASPYHLVLRALQAALGIQTGGRR